MEQWSFPPRFDDNYFPDASSRYWFPKRESMHAADREKAILGRLQELCAYAYDKAPFYKRHWDEAGFHPSMLKSLEDFEEKVPVVDKAHLRAAQQAHEPFGDYLCVDPSEVHHIHGTSGTTGRPTAFAISRDDWRSIANAHARIMWAMGLRPGDTICVAAIFSLYMGSWGALAGSERLHAKTFPFGAGATGMSARCAQWLNMLKPQAFYGTPTYALHLAAVAKEEGLNPRDFGLKVLFFSGEPGGSIPGIRDRIEEMYGAKVYDSGSMGEMTPWMHLGGAEGAEGMLCWQDIVYTEVCDPTSHVRVPYGQRGTPIYTHLERTSQPMIRYKSGDLALWKDGPTGCGRTYPSLPQGIIGRIDDQFTVRGENVYPSEIDAALNQLDGYGGEHRILISREAAMDEMVIRIEVSDAIARNGAEAIDVFRAHATAHLQKLCGVRAGIEIAAQNTIERTDFKARRVIDNRAELQAALAQQQA